MKCYFLRIICRPVLLVKLMRISWLFEVAVLKMKKKISMKFNWTDIFFLTKLKKRYVNKTNLYFTKCIWFSGSFSSEHIEEYLTADLHTDNDGGNDQQFKLHFGIISCSRLSNKTEQSCLLQHRSVLL